MKGLYRERIMSRPDVVQVPLKSLKKRFEDFMEKEGIGNRAEAGRRLFDLALRMTENDSEALTNRQLLEEIYVQTKRNGCVNNIVHTQTFDEEKRKKYQSEAHQIRTPIIESIEEKARSFICISSD